MLMIILIAIAGFLVLGFGALAAIGRLGEMPAPVNSRPVSRIPSGKLTPERLAEVEFLSTGRKPGYDPKQVDQLVNELASGEKTAAYLSNLELDMVPRDGYPFLDVDQVIDRFVADSQSGIYLAMYPNGNEEFDGRDEATDQ